MGEVREGGREENSAQKRMYHLSGECRWTISVLKRPKAASA
jgi:hypothetical protein